MVPLIILAGRNNTCNLLHRWMGRIVVFEIITYTNAWTVPSVANYGMDRRVETRKEIPLLCFGGLA